MLFGVICRKLQNRGPLTQHQVRQQNHLAIGELKCVVVLLGLVHIELSKACQTIVDAPREQGANHTSTFFENELCARSKANSGVGI
jgi:hypothetical protein